MSIQDRTPFRFRRSCRAIDRNGVDAAWRDLSHRENPPSRDPSPILSSRSCPKPLRDSWKKAPQFVAIVVTTKTQKRNIYV